MISRTKRLSVSIFAVVIAVAARAEMIMYDGVPGRPSLVYNTLFKGFSQESKEVGFFRPSTSTYVIQCGKDTGTTLSTPACFAESAAIPEVIVAGTNGSVIVSSSTGNAGYGAKTLTLSDNCQARTGKLHFRFLLSADQSVLDAMSADTGVAPAPETVQSCGLIWSVDDYTKAAVTNTSLRYVSGYQIESSANTTLGTSRATIGFARGLMIGLRKNASGVAEIRLYAWGKDAEDYTADVRSMVLASDITAGKTYVCYVQIDIDAYSNGDDRIRGMAQTVDTYDKTADWAGAPYPQFLRTDLIGGEGASSLYAHLTIQGKNYGAAGGGFLYFDEFALATERTDTVVWTPPREDFSSLLAYDAFPCGDGGYGTGEITMNWLSANVGIGFAGAWSMYVNKGAFCLLGEGTGLSLPSVYQQEGIASVPGTSLGPSTSVAQGQYVRRAFTDGLLGLSTGDILNMRCLISVDAAFIGGLPVGPDNDGTLIVGTVGVNGAVNYGGAGIADCSVQLESGSHAPCLCRRGNACFFTVTKCADGTVGVYLNLLSGPEDTPRAVKIMPVDPEVGGTFLCYARIEIGTGEGGKEKIRAFACDVSSVTGHVVADWIPPRKHDAEIEHEIISSSAYPKHAIAGSKVTPGFRFDEFALSLGADQFPLVWARYLPEGTKIILR